MNNSKLINIALIITVVGLLGLVMYVKKDSAQQAKDYVKKTLDAVDKKLKADKELRLNNNLLWELVIDLKDGKQDRKSIIKKAKLFQAKHKENINLSITAVKENTAHWSIGWEKVQFEIFFNKRGNLESMNLDQLLGKEQ